MIADRERRDALANVERLKEKKNRLSGEIGKLKKNRGDAGALMRGPLPSPGPAPNKFDEFLDVA